MREVSLPFLMSLNTEVKAMMMADKMLWDILIAL